MIYLVAWTGGLEQPQYQACTLLSEAMEVAGGWLMDAAETDTIQILGVSPHPDYPSVTVIEDF